MNLTRLLILTCLGVSVVDGLVSSSGSALSGTPPLRSTPALLWRWADFIWLTRTSSVVTAATNRISLSNPCLLWLVLVPARLHAVTAGEGKPGPICWECTETHGRVSLQTHTQSQNWSERYEWRFEPLYIDGSWSLIYHVPHSIKH